MVFSITTFYKFTNLTALNKLRQQLCKRGEALGIVGTILIAEEGINSTIAGSPENLDRFMSYLRSIPLLSDLEEKRATTEKRPFYRFKVRIKKEIVTLGLPEISPLKAVGEYVEPEDWNTLLEDPEVTLVDTRNNYEVMVGKFENAMNPETESFSQFPDWVSRNLDPEKNPRVAMYCTGGIRCEKATSLLKERGFREVYHLKGGILKYLENIPAKNSRWSGSCFVFDNRVGIGHGLHPTDWSSCGACRHPLSPADRKDSKYEPGVTCPWCYGTHSEDKLERLRERQKQVELAHRRGELHIGQQLNPE